MATKTLKAGVIGAGVFGGYHANKYAQSAQANLVGVFDIDMGRARITAQNHGAQGEKPIAQTAEQADELIALAADKGLILAVGHQERAIFEAMGLLEIDEIPTRIEAARVGRASERGTDVSVTLDLLIHDADLVMALMPGDFTHVKAIGKSVYTKTADEIVAEISFDNGSAAHLISGRTAQETTRTMRIEYPSGVIDMDFVRREFSNTTPHKLNADFAATPQGQDPLGANVERFIDAILGKASKPLVRGQGGARALALALAIDKAAGFG